MDPVTAVVLGVVVSVLMLGFVVASVTKGARRTQVRRERQRPELLELRIDPELTARIDTLIEQGKPIHAIKELRAAHPDLRLADAKELVDAIRAGHRPPSTSEPELVSGSGAPPARSDLADRVRELRAGRRETEAIRLVCDETGMGILDAQKFVRALE